MVLGSWFFAPAGVRSTIVCGWLGEQLLALHKLDPQETWSTSVSIVHVNACWVWSASSAPTCVPKCPVSWADCFMLHARAS